MTWWWFKAARTWATTASPRGLARSRPPISAPIVGESGRTSSSVAIVTDQVCPPRANLNRRPPIVGRAPVPLGRRQDTEGHVTISAPTGKKRKLFVLVPVGDPAHGDHPTGPTRRHQLAGFDPGGSAAAVAWTSARTVPQAVLPDVETLETVHARVTGEKDRL